MNRVCPICKTIIRVAEDPSPEYRGQMDNIYQGVNNPNYMFYHDKDREETQKQYYYKQKKNFPGNKRTDTRFETPEDTPSIVADFLYAKCSNCGHRLIKLSDGKEEWGIQGIEKRETPDTEAHYYKKWGDFYTIVIKRKSHYGGFYSDSFVISSADYDELKGLNEKQLAMKLMNYIPVPIREAFEEHKKEIREYDDWDSFWDNFRGIVEDNDFIEGVFDEMTDSYAPVLAKELEEEIYEISRAEINEYLRIKYEEGGELDEMGWDWWDHADMNYEIDNLTNFTEEEFVKRGEDTAKWNFDDSRHHGNIEAPDDLPMWGAEADLDDYEKEMKEYYIDKYREYFVSWVGGDVGYDLQRRVASYIVERLQNEDDSEYYVEFEDGTIIPAFPSREIKNFMLRVAGDFMDEYTEEQINAIPVEDEVDENTLRQYQSAFESKGQTYFDLEKQARQPDMPMDNLLSHENMPNYDNMPMNNTDSLKEDMKRVESSPDEEDEDPIITKYIKSKNGINFRKEDRKEIGSFT
jgi:hypothetical protein